MRTQVMGAESDEEIIPPEDRIGFLLYRAGLAVAQAYEALMRPLGFIPAEVGLLTHLAAKGPCHVRDAARALGVSPQTVVNIGRSLEAKRLVDRAASTKDRRAVILTITALGGRALAKADSSARRLDRLVEVAAGSDAEAAIRAMRAVLEQEDAINADLSIEQMPTTR